MKHLLIIFIFLFSSSSFAAATAENSNVYQFKKPAKEVLLAQEKALLKKGFALRDARLKKTLEATAKIIAKRRAVYKFLALSTAFTVAQGVVVSLYENGTGAIKAKISDDGSLQLAEEKYDTDEVYTLDGKYFFHTYNMETCTYFNGGASICYRPKSCYKDASKPGKLLCNRKIEKYTNTAGEVQITESNASYEFPISTYGNVKNSGTPGEVGGGPETNIKPAGEPRTPQDYEADDFESLSDQLPESLKNVDLSDKALADLANLIARNAAAQPGYDGLPYNYSEPIKATDAAHNKLKLGEFLKPSAIVQAPGSNGVSEPMLEQENDPLTDPSSFQPVDPNVETDLGEPASQPQSGTGLNTGLGEDPAIPYPTLETPNAADIMTPFVELINPVFNSEFTASPGACDMQSFTLANLGTFDFNQICVALETHRPFFSAIMTLGFIFASIRIILGA